MPLRRNLLRGQRVYLSALGEDAVGTITGWYQDAGFLRTFDTSPAKPSTEADTTRWIEDSQQSDRIYSFGVCLINGDRLIGIAELEDVDGHHATGEAVIGIGEASYRGQGYGGEALSLLLDFAFDELNLHRVRLNVLGYNTPAIRLYQRMGFRREGILREGIARDGKRYDELIFGMLHHEWGGDDEAD